MKLHGRTSVRVSLEFLFVALLFVLPQSIYGQSGASENPVEGFRDLLKTLTSTQDSAEKARLVTEFVSTLSIVGTPLRGDSSLHFLYHGKAGKVSVAGDINRWNPAEDTLTRIAGTDLFHLTVQMHPAARFEYKLVIDSVWILDPLNPQQVAGGFGPNSEVRMPLYHPPSEVEFRPDIPHGRIDTLFFQSTILNRTHPVYVYLPPGYNASSRTRLSSVYVLDGGEYLLLAKMATVLDNLIADRRIYPTAAIFVDPRSDPRNAASSTRMQDYVMRDSFLTFLANELRPMLLKKYRIDKHPGRTAIMGASLGGLMATYSAFTRPDVFGLCAAQSPSYWWMNDSIITLIQQSARKNITFYIGTGTIRDAQDRSSKMRDVLLNKGYAVRYEEHPEGHNWANWQARISSILEYFWSRK